MFEKKFVMSLLCLVVALSLSATATMGANILFVSSMTEVGDDALKAFMEGLGHTVTYLDDDEDEATTEAAAIAADLVFISESVGSGGIKNEITELEVPMIVGEPWAWDEMGLTEGSGGDGNAVTIDAEIADPGHYMAAGLSGTVAVLTEVIEGGNLGKGITGPEATVIATATLSDGVTYDVIFVYEKGAALPVAPADGSAQVAADIRIGFGFHAICYPVLSENAYALLGAAVDYALGETGPPAEADGRLIVPKTSVAPIIDAELDDVWQNVGEEGLLITEIINATSAVPDDLNDLSGTFKVMHDDDNFYIYVVIQDSVIDYEFSNHNGDGVEFFFDGDNSKGSSYDGVNDNQIRITVDDVELTNIDSSLPVDGSAFKVILTDLGYNIEASFPLEKLQIVPENTFGFEVQINDNDGGGGRETLIRWFSNDNNSWQDASLFGEAVLTAEPEAEGPKIIWVSYHGADDEPHADAATVGFTQAPDIGYTDLLKANGYNVTRVITSGTPDVEVLNAADLVIISRTASSGHYSNDSATMWNSITSPMINLNGYTLRSSRMGYTTGTTMVDTTGDVRLTVTDPAHPIFAGIPLTDGTMDNLFAEGAVVLPTDGVTVSRGISINNDPADDDGTVLATIAEASADTGPVGGMVIAEWPAGATMENSSGSPTDVLGGPRLVFLTGSREPSGITGGQAAALYDLYPDGEQMFLNAVKYMIPAKPVDPGTDGLAAFYALENDVLDGSGNGNDGTIVGAPTFVDGPAGYGMAMEFHGLGAPGGGGDYIDCGNDASLDITGPISLALWIRPGADDPEGQGTTTAPMAKAMDGMSPSWSYQVRYGWGSSQPYMAFTFNSSPRAWVYVGKNLERDEWCHIACSHDGTTLKCYLNGEQTDSTPMGQITSSPAPVLIGSDGWGCDWIGGIDEVAIYNRDLSAGEVRYLAGFRAMVDPGTDGLAAAYEFETDATDSSGNGNDGTLLGDAHVLGGLLVLDGDDDAVAIPGIGDGLTEFTFSMMVYPTVDVVPLQFSGGINTDSWGGGIHLKLNNGTVNVGVNGLGGGDVVGTSIAQPNTWTHLALTVSPDEVAVYFNGEKEGSRVGEAVPAVNVGAATIGAWNNGGTDVQREMTGMMDNVLIYNRALSEAEVRYLASVRTDPVNLVQNPSFEEDEVILDDPDWEKWTTWNPAEGAGSNATIVDTDSIDGARSLMVEPKGAENWHFMVLQDYIPLEVGKNYIATFWAKAEAARPLGVQMKATDNSVSWGYTDFELTTEWAECTMTSEALSAEAKLEIFCAGVEVPVWLDLVSVYEAE